MGLRREWWQFSPLLSVMQQVLPCKYTHFIKKTCTPARSYNYPVSHHMATVQCIMSCTHVHVKSYRWRLHQTKHLDYDVVLSKTVDLLMGFSQTVSWSGVKNEKPSVRDSTSDRNALLMRVKITILSNRDEQNSISGHRSCWTVLESSLKWEQDHQLDC